MSEQQQPDQKKITAAVSAVVQYLRDEEEAARLQAAITPFEAARPWGLSGRQAMMQMRNLMQMRAFR